MTSTNPLQLTLDRIFTNPLVAALPPKRSVNSLATALRHRPITPANVRDIAHKDRHHLVGEFRRIFVPTEQTLSIACSLQQMLLDGLSQRDPNAASAKRFIFQGGMLKGKLLDELEWWPTFASGMVLEGITGTGKSQLIDRFLSLYPQVIEHGHNEACGWKTLKQLVWLKVHMSSDGSRGGFLKGAFLELDKALGTDYASQYGARSWTVEKNLVVFLHLLAVHRCGLLVIEEAQAKNLAQSEFGREFVTFFLRLLNWGVPTVLIGNPMAFTNLRSFSQDVDRFSEGGWFHIHPMMDPDSEEWTEDWMPGLWHPTLLELADAPFHPLTDDPTDQALSGFIWRRTAGIPRYVCRLRREVQDHALRTGAKQVTAAMVDRVYRESEKMIALHPRIEAFVKRDWKALRRFDDIPWDYFRRLWCPQTEDPVVPDAQQRQEPDAEKTSPRKSKGGKVSKSRPTKANPMASQSFSADEVEAKEFQKMMIAQLSKSAGIDPD
jgi:hypothetical protein